MIRQYRASSLSKQVFESVSKLRKQKDYKFKIIGLLESLSTFDTLSEIPIEAPDEIPPLLAVANNLITRGNPTIASEKVNASLSSFLTGFSELDFYYALHLVDTRPSILKLYDEDLGSRFEEVFLNDIIPEDKRFLVQFFQHQRPKKTLVNNSHDNGKVDFSFESPYYKEVTRTTIYQRPKQLKQRSVSVIEVDGKRYHDTRIDDIRDYETATFGHTTNRITEDNAYEDTEGLIRNLLNTEYFKVIETLYSKGFPELKRLQEAVLIPVSVSRIQKVINQYLIANYNEFRATNKTKIKIAIVERDVPCGNLAVDDLNELYANLLGLEGKQSFIPEVETVIFSDGSFSNENPLNEIRRIATDKIVTQDYDLVIDVATLWRTGIFKADKDFGGSKNSIVIRSSHYTQDDCIDNIYCADSIQYRPLTIETGNDQHIEIPEVLPFAEYFLWNVFQKPKFRPGQLPILNRALQGKTVIGLLPTGGGKSLTYQLAALLQPGLTIIIDPIKSLMVDQYEGLLNNGIDKCDFINSVLSREEKEFVQNKIVPNGKAQFLFCSPERLVIQEFRDALNKTKQNGYYFSYCVIDEAHCVSEWGHDFRTPYLNLGENVISNCKTANGNDVPIFGLTATASFDVLADIERELKISNDDGKSVIRYANTVRDEINYQIHPIEVDGEVDETVGDKKQQRTASCINGLNLPDKGLLVYNTTEVYKNVLSKTYDEYLPESEKSRIQKIDFIETETQRILIGDNELPLQKMEDGKFNYGAIVFCPHKTGKLGVHPYVDFLKANCQEEEVVFFVGSSGTSNFQNEDQHAFENLRRFKEDEASVMVATKAFGMGIDKPNVRITVHSNMSSSIESFVQESGRAGRDGKTSLSVILYNQTGKDRNVLDQFHRNSFKGADKERSIIWELRNEIYYPSLTNLQALSNFLSDEFNIELNLELGNITANGNDWTAHLYVKDVNQNNLGSVNIENKTTHYFESPELASQYLRVIEGFIPRFQELSKDQVREFLQNKTVNTDNPLGIEELLKNNEFDLNEPVVIPFRNRFLSKGSRQGSYVIDDEYALNNHFYHLKENQRIQELINRGFLSEESLMSGLRNAIDKDKTFEDFINGLPIKDQEIKKVLIGSERLKVRYYIPRNEEDTAKAIYRLISVGVIRTYTIEYQQKVFKIYLNKLSEGGYFKKYEELVARYISNVEAEKLRKECEADFRRNNADGNATEISVCLSHLTDFVYDKIASKRKRAIDDMDGLCRETITVLKSAEQSEKIKERIYYYFNAKYARTGNVATNKLGLEVPADMNQDKEFSEINPIQNIIWKYIEEIVDYDDGGQRINNMKHLRGACMSMLTGFLGKAPQFNILKAYSLYFLSDHKDNPEEYVIEAIAELKQGVKDWEELRPDDFDFEAFFIRFKKNLEGRIRNLNDDMFDDVDDEYYATKNLNWLTKFNDKFLKDYTHANRTSS